MFDDETKRQLEEKHVELVIEANQRVNMTRIDSFASAMLLHIEDSQAGVPEVDAAPAGAAADLGSGAGFPGVPLAIETGRHFHLVESIGKKAKVLEGIVGSLGLQEHITVCNQRIEELSLSQPRHFAVVTARALSALNALVELASPLLQDGGRLVAYKSGDYQAELDAALAIQEKVAMYHLSTRAFTLSDGETQRSIIVFEKRGEPRVTLPRRPGMAQKHPYR